MSYKMNSSVIIAISSEENSNITVSIVDDELHIIKMSVYLPIMFFSITGNTLVILSVLLFQRLKTVPNIFIANLAACDFITTISSIPFDLASEELGYWPYGGFMCKVLWPLATFSTTAAVFTLLSISGDRYGALLHPLNFGNKITKKKCFVIIFLGYVLAALAVVPYTVFLKYYPKPEYAPQCGEEWPSLKYRKAYTVFLFSIQYAIPLPIMTYIYIRLGLLLYNSTRVANKLSGEKMPLSSAQNMKTTSEISNNSFSSSNIVNRRQMSIQRRKEQNEKTVKMFLLIVAIFLIFMLPNQILWILYDFGDPELLSSHIDLVAFVCRAFTYTNSVLNVVIYGACNGSFRMAFKSILRCRCGKRHQRDLKRSLTVFQGRHNAGNNRRHPKENYQQKNKTVSYRKTEWSTAEGTSNSFDETCQAHLQTSDSTKNNSTPQSSMNNCSAMQGKTPIDSGHCKSNNNNMLKEGESCLLEAERLFNKLSKEIGLEKALNVSKSKDKVEQNCIKYLQETRL
ncbi:QRFP-like peptide receptor [Actinia tenebrosa]|uniref:QRFP-like peptide receptor n=1 Tax=Actinia tenebrosa TaxID=6105 RepID=A0A6P8I085_ACTTE|nr:QRFP-like peptide receptor [Actinia tenebrosa]XP_031561129.1 QRFP-like peptide receptor [Actinia tenebrosa]XP_031561130.1 QRFP-like peptide receptor [Actinia tenebrosa]XP_031561131.1 QRFP-like peptide receptor [Actinia tenebrosa]